MTKALSHTKSLYLKKTQVLSVPNQRDDIAKLFLFIFQIFLFFLLFFFFYIITIISKKLIYSLILLQTTILIQQQLTI